MRLKAPAFAAISRAKVEPVTCQQHAGTAGRTGDLGVARGLFLKGIG